MSSRGGFPGSPSIQTSVLELRAQRPSLCGNFGPASIAGSLRTTWFGVGLELNDSRVEDVEIQFP